MLLIDDNDITPGGTGVVSRTAMTAPQSTAYAAARSIPAAQRTPTQSQIVSDGDAAIATVTAGWTAGQQAVDDAITNFITDTQLEVQRAIRKAMSGGKTLNEQALTEMFSTITNRMGQLARMTFELYGP